MKQFQFEFLERKSFVENLLEFKKSNRVPGSGTALFPMKNFHL